MALDINTKFVDWRSLDAAVRSIADNPSFGRMKCSLFSLSINKKNASLFLYNAKEC